VAVALCAAAAHSQPHTNDGPLLDDALAGQVRQLASDGTRALPQGQTARVEVTIGQLDPRLRLAPCDKVEPYLPANTRLWGRTRVGLRCASGPSRWNVYLPITVKVYARAVVTSAALPAGSVLTAADVAEAEVDWAEDRGTVYTRPDVLVGRTLARALTAGEELRHTDLRPRIWFAAGDTVRITGVGNGFAVGGSGEALTAGVEGQNARVRTESGRVVNGTPMAARQLELAL
jgi:flagella basal body P-ring formation protein FlgA